MKFSFFSYYFLFIIYLIKVNIITEYIAPIIADLGMIKILKLVPCIITSMLYIIGTIVPVIATPYNGLYLLNNVNKIYESINVIPKNCNIKTLGIDILNIVIFVKAINNIVNINEI